MAVKPIRDGFHTVTPYLMVPGAPKLLEYLAAAFDAKVLFSVDRPDGSLGHAELRIGDSMVMLGEPVGPFGPMPAQIYLYVPECDATYRRAISAGGATVMEPTTMSFSGERYGGVKDPCGNIWWIATHVEDVTAQEVSKRLQNLQKPPTASS